MNYHQRVLFLEEMYEVGTFIRRLRHKPFKRNIALSNQLLLRDNPDHRMVSRPGELPFANYRKIDNATGLLPLLPRRPSAV